MGLKSRRRRAADTVVEGEPTIGEEHAWWAERDHLESAYTPPSHDAADDHDLREFWSPESLFTYDHRFAHEVSDEDLIADPYGALGLPMYASWSQVTAAHRSLAKQFHPDVMVGAPDDERARGEERMREVNRAYNQIRRSRDQR